VGLLHVNDKCFYLLATKKHDTLFDIIILWSKYSMSYSLTGTNESHCSVHCTKLLCA